MIGRLRGIIAQKSDGSILIDVAGVGYVVHCSDRTIANLPATGEEAIIWTDLQVREDLMQLFGFANEAEREWYWLLVSVQGVGSKAALAILGTLGVNSLSRALTLGDINAVKAAPGIGPKLAARICNELKEKAAKLMGSIQAPKDDFQVIDFPASAAPSSTAPAAPREMGYEGEAISALVNLGYDRVLAAQTISGLADEAESLDALIKAALRAMAPKG